MNSSALRKTLITLTSTDCSALLHVKVSYNLNNNFYLKLQKNFIYFCPFMKDFLLDFVERCSITSQYDKLYVLLSEKIKKFYKRYL